jgi:hypothetical protein
MFFISGQIEAKKASLTVKASSTIPIEPEACSQIAKVLLAKDPCHGRTSNQSAIISFGGFNCSDNPRGIEDTFLTGSQTMVGNAHVDVPLHVLHDNLIRVFR